MNVNQCIFFQLSAASRLGTQFFSRQVDEWNLTPAQAMVVNFLGEEENIPFSRLGEKLHLTSATLTGIVDRLEKIGLVERRPNIEDRRSLLVGLTKEGKAIAPDLHKRMEDANSAFLQNFSNKEEAMLRGLLDRLEEP